MNADLLAFVREALSRGIPREAIADQLRGAGWRPEEISGAMASWADTSFPLPVPRRRPYLSAREAFLYLVLFATLYATAFNVGAVLFVGVDRWMPDASQPWEAARLAEASRGGTAGLLIAFPIFLSLSYVIGRGVRLDPEKRASKIRKWLTYITLFVAAMVLIGDLTFLVFKLLSGELPTRVLLKVLVVLVIAGIVFLHYLADLRGEEREAAGATRARVPPRAVAAATLAVLVLGLVTAGSPRLERLRRLDELRLEDLRAIRQGIGNWTQKGRALPASLGALATDPDSPVLRLRDPETQKPYDYRLIDDRHYELCATFATADSLGNAGHPGEAAGFWKHPVDRTCYTLEATSGRTSP
jgi:hypothetical protein